MHQEIVLGLAGRPIHAAHKKERSLNGERYLPPTKHTTNKRNSSRVNLHPLTWGVLTDPASRSRQVHLYPDSTPKLNRSEGARRAPDHILSVFTTLEIDPYLRSLRQLPTLLTIPTATVGLTKPVALTRTVEVFVSTNLIVLP